MRSLLCFTPLFSALLSISVHATQDFDWDGTPLTWGPESLVVTAHPDTMSLFASAEGFGGIPISGPVDGLSQPGMFYAGFYMNSWYYPDTTVRVDVSALDGNLTVRFEADNPGRLMWPVIDDHPSIEAWILPLAEGHFVPADDEEWIDNLVEHSPINTTESLSMPWIALDMDGFTVTYIFENQFNNEITFENQNGRLAARVTHEFRDNWDVREQRVHIFIGEDSPIAPALIYREWLIDRGEFVSMEEKIERLPSAERLLGAAQIYLFGQQLLAREDIARADWPEFCSRLASAEQGSVGQRVFSLLNEEARQAVLGLPNEEWPNDWMKGLIVEDVSRAITENGISVEDFHTEFSDLLGNPSTWGDGYSTKMIDAIAEAGVDRALLVLDGYEESTLRPNVAQYADEMGYLLGSYDSYHSMHRPDANPGDTWTTAQFGLDAWENLGVMRADGTYGSGFRGEGRHVNPTVAMPLVESRMEPILRAVPFNAWFVDCDAYGEFFDDYHPDHPANQQDDMEARVDRLAWFSEQENLVVGSEGGSAYAVPVLHYAHGIMTPCFGWGDPALHDRESEYFLGTYYPPDGPRVFTQQVTLAPGYEKFQYDPRYRLPLYQTAFHDSICATHWWGYHSLKFTDQIVTTELTELLYQVAPLYTLNLRELARHRDRISAHHAFFSPLHRESTVMPLTQFGWLSEDRLIQFAVYGDEITMVSNFSDVDRAFGGTIIPARSAISHRLSTGEIAVFTPAEP